MPTINQLSTADVLVGADQVPIYSSENGDARKTSLNAIKDFVLQPSDATGILAISSLFVFRKTVQVVANLTTAYQNIANYDQTLVAPANRTSISLSPVLGEMILTRDIAVADFNVAFTGSWATNRDLTLAVLVGTDLAPFESSFKYIGAGRGNGVAVTATFSGPVANLNNGGNIIKAGEKIRLVAKMNVADTLTITQVAFVVQPLDGI